MVVFIRSDQIYLMTELLSLGGGILFVPSSSSLEVGLHVFYLYLN